MGSNSTKDIFLNGQYILTEMFWSKGVGNRLTTSIISEQNHKLFRSILWSSFRNHKSVQNIMRGKSPSSSTPCHFVASTLRSILRESLRNLGQCTGNCFRLHLVDWINLWKRGKIMFPPPLYNKQPYRPHIYSYLGVLDRISGLF